MFGVLWPKQLNDLAEFSRRMFGHYVDTINELLLKDLDKFWKIIYMQKIMEFYMTLLLHVTLSEQISVWRILKFF